MSPIYINNKKIESIYINNQSIGKVYVGDVLVFQKNNYTGDPFIFTIDTTLGTGDSFDLPLRSGYNYDMLVDWGDGSSNIITSFDQTEKLHTYSTGGEYQISITGLCEAWYFNDGGDKLKLTTINQWGDTGFINMGSAFNGCSYLTTANDTNGIWCSNVTNMGFMFYNCSSLQTLDVSNWDVSNVTEMGVMFYNCSSLQTLDVSNWNTSAVIGMNNMFSYCSSLTTLDVSNWNTSAVTAMSRMFIQCTSLTTLNLSGWNVENVLPFVDSNSMYRMFVGCPLSTASYDAALIAWSQQNVQSGVRLDAPLSKYSSGAATTARGILTSAPNYWTINDDGQL